MMKFFRFFIPLSFFYLCVTNSYAQQPADPHSVDSSTSDTTIHKLLDSAPKLFDYKGDSFIERLDNYWSDNLKLKPRSKCKGVVFIQVVVEKDGSLSNPVVLRGLEGKCQESINEAIEAIGRMPKFIPGKYNGRVVRAYMTLTLRYPLK